jgi:hypothetical protein
MKRILFLFLIQLSTFGFFSFAQNLTGIWRGYFITDGLDQYRFEVQVEQKSNSLSGVTYSYLDRRFYGKATFTGNFNKTSQNALIQEIKTVEVRMSSLSSSCIQKFQLFYERSGNEEFLEGTFTSIIEKSDSLGNRRGDDCGGGKMYLRKVATTDFYLEPFLRKRTLPKVDNQNPPVVKNTKPNPKPPITNKNTKTKNVVVKKPKADSAQAEDTYVESTPQKITSKSAINTPFKSRENNLIQTIVVTSEDVIVKLYDNGEIDDDTISIYLNKKLILSKQRLTAAALTVKLRMDENNPDHELIMVAENLGRIPPNTSLMIVNAGDKRYEVRITSTEQKNAMVRFKYVKSGTPQP